MTDASDGSQVVFVKYATKTGEQKIARHMRTALLSADEQIDDFVRDVVHEYKANPDLTYLGLADEEEYEAFNRIRK